MWGSNRHRRWDAGTLAVIGVFVVLTCAHLAAADVPTPVPALDLGFRQMYDLDFAGAQKNFETWERKNPDSPMGPVGEAASVLFSELNRLGVLEAQFYENDSVFTARKKYNVPPEERALLEMRLNRAEELARNRLRHDPRDRDALLALTMAYGLRSDFAALIENRNAASLHYTKEATAWATQLLAADPGCDDGHLAGGISSYLIGSMSAPVRWFLRLGGLPADKRRGIQELQITARGGRLLAPFARILLAIAYVREKQPRRARELLISLQHEFPDNPLFGRELTRIDKMESR